MTTPRYDEKLGRFVKVRKARPVEEQTTYVTSVGPRARVVKPAKATRRRAKR